jgi:hypothetical protein
MRPATATAPICLYIAFALCMHLSPCCYRVVVPTLIHVHFEMQFSGNAIHSVIHNERCCTYNRKVANRGDALAPPKSACYSCSRKTELAFTQQTVYNGRRACTQPRFSRDMGLENVLISHLGRPSHIVSCTCRLALKSWMCYRAGYQPRMRVVANVRRCDCVQNSAGFAKSTSDTSHVIGHLLAVGAASQPVQGVSGSRGWVQARDAREALCEREAELAAAQNTQEEQRKAAEVARAETVAAQEQVGLLLAIFHIDAASTA